MFHRRLADAVGIRGRKVDVAWAVLLVAHVPLALEQPQHSSDSRIGRRISEIFQDLGSVGAATAVDDLHDLPLASSELAQCMVFHHPVSSGVKPNMSSHWHDVNTLTLAYPRITVEEAARSRRGYARQTEQRRDFVSCRRR